MEQHVCTCCGSQLKHKENEYVCPYCGAVYEDDYEQRAAYTLKELLDEAKIESLANAVRRLYEAAHKKYPSKDEVVNAANAVLQLNPNNLLAKMYIASHEFDPMNLNLLLASAQCSPAEAKEIVRWLLPSLSPRTVGASLLISTATVSAGNMLDYSFKMHGNITAEGLWEAGWKGALKGVATFGVSFVARTNGLFLDKTYSPTFAQDFYFLNPCKAWVQRTLSYRLVGEFGARPLFASAPAALIRWLIDQW